MNEGAISQKFVYQPIELIKNASKNVNKIKRKLI